MGKTTRLKPIPAFSAALDEGEGDFAPGDPNIDQFMAELGDSAKAVALTIQDEKDKTRWSYLARIPLDDFSLEVVKEQYGGGRYRGRILDEDNHYMKHGHFSFAIDGRFKRPVPDLPETSPPVVPFPAPASATESTALGEMKEVVRQQGEAMIRLMEKISTQPDPLTMVLKVAEVMKPAAQSSPSMDLAGMFGLFSTIFTKGMELAQNSSGEGGYIPVLKELGGPLLGMLTERLQKGETALEKARVSGLVAVPPPKPTLDGFVKIYMPQLLTLARMGKDPELYADVMLDQIPEIWLEELVGRVNQPDFVDKLKALYPDVGPFEGWFKKLAEYIRVEFAPDAGAEPGGANSGGSPEGG
jgi:hypothetical protein